MSAVKLMGFGGMLPAVDPRLLPDDSAADAQNVWFYNGGIEGIRVPTTIYVPTPGTRAVFRVPKAATDLQNIDNSYWLEFTTVDINIVKTPIAESADPTYYWANGTAVPGYTSFSRIAAGDPPLVLGIPPPSVAPGVVPAGGTGVTETRAYVYTWVSAYGEEGAPSPPTVVTGKVDDTWAITLTAPTGSDTTDRVLDKTNIYRTVTSSAGVASYYFVAQLPIATLAYDDTIPDDQVINAGTLESTDYAPPPAGLQGLAALPNGILCGWLDNEIWFCEPYKPHAWPAKYQISTEYDIVAMVGAGQTLIIGTQAFPYYATGISPDHMTLQRIPAAEPCLSRGSMVGSAFGAFYASPNGLIFVNALGQIAYPTRDTISKAAWQSLLDLRVLRAALLNGAYFVYCGVNEAAFEPTAFEPTAFQTSGEGGTLAGALIEFQQTNVGFSRLLAPMPIFNVQQDTWTGEVLIVSESKVEVLNLTAQDMMHYIWLSKIFPLAYPDNLSVMKITWEPPLGTDEPVGTVTVIADGKVRLTRPIPPSDTIFRLPSGYKANAYQFGITGNLIVKSVQIATSAEELRTV